MDFEGYKERGLEDDYLPDGPLDVDRAHCVERQSGTPTSRTKTGFSIQGPPRGWDGKIKVYSLSDFDNGDMGENDEGYRPDVISFLFDQPRGF